MKKLGAVLALERIMTKYIFPAGSLLTIEASTTLYFAERIISKYKGWFEELESIRVNEVAVLATPKVKNTVRTKWALRVKYAGCCKGRLVALGWRQRHGIDCAISVASVCRLDN